jgi:predicted PurR-regulated permease PerM
MTEIIIHRPRNRARVVFLSVWAAIAVVVLLAAREILLPFILALVVAYVLAPAVGWVENSRVPRWGAVILVYVITIGGTYASLAAMAPRLGLEMRGLFRDLPAIAATIRDEQVPPSGNGSNLTGASQPPYPSSRPRERTAARSAAKRRVP